MGRRSYDDFGGKRLTIHDKILLRNQANPPVHLNPKRPAETSREVRDRIAEKDERIAELEAELEALQESGAVDEWVDPSEDDLNNIEHEHDEPIDPDPEPVPPGNTPIGCPSCGKTYKTLQGLQAHTAKEHP